MDEFGDRMKAYENVEAKRRLDVTLPICARIDGRSFSTFTRHYARPFDSRISTAMRETCAYLVEETHARIGFVQSDEISLVWQADEGGSIIFDGRVQKMCSVLASMAGVKFYSVLGGDKLPAFDCRVWQVPSQVEAANVLLWRAMDARKNSVSAVCRAYYSPKQMHGQGQADMREMLMKAGVNFDKDILPEDRHGVFYKRVSGVVRMDDETWNRIPDAHKPDSRDVVRSWVEPVFVGYFGDVADRVGFVFDA